MRIVKKGLNLLEMDNLFAAGQMYQARNRYSCSCGC